MSKTVTNSWDENSSVWTTEVGKYKVPVEVHDDGTIKFDTDDRGALVFDVGTLRRFTDLVFDFMQDRAAKSWEEV